MYNRPHRQNMWCANAWVGAPWACGEARYDMPVENYEHDVANSYEGYAPVNCSFDGKAAHCDSAVFCGPNGARSEWNGKCTSINKKSKCQKSYEKSGGNIANGTPTIICDYKGGECKRTKQYCANSELCINACTAPSPTPTGGGTAPTGRDVISCSPTPSVPVSGLSGTASTTFYGTQANGEANDPYLNNKKDSSCGCNTEENGANVLSDWYNAAANDTLFGVDTGEGDSTDWNCGSGCGRCFELTTTGKRADNDSWGYDNDGNPVERPDANQKIKVVVTNLCPNDSNKWCPRPGTTNGDFISAMGGTGAYKYHFDLQNSFPDGAVSWAGCDGKSCNAEVQFQEIECPDCVKTALKANCKGTSPPGWASDKDNCKYS